MTREQLQQIRDALQNNIHYSHYGTAENERCLAILDAALAAPAQEPVAWCRPEDGYSFPVPPSDLVKFPKLKEWHTVPLYAAPVPAPQREWHDPVAVAYRKELDALSQRNYELRLENAALKEKNHG